MKTPRHTHMMTPPSRLRLSTSNSIVTPVNVKKSRYSGPEMSLTASWKPSPVRVKLTSTKPATMQQMSGSWKVTRPASSSSCSSKNHTQPMNMITARCDSATTNETTTIAPETSAAPHESVAIAESGERALHQRKKGSALPIPMPMSTETISWKKNCSSSLSGLCPFSAAAPWLMLESSVSWSTTRSVKVYMSTTTTSISTVTVRTVVVNGPLACISSMMAIADEGERATARHASSSTAASFSAGARWPRNGM